MGTAFEYGNLSGLLMHVGSLDIEPFLRASSD